MTPNNSAATPKKPQKFRYNVLVVDDNAILLRTVREMLNDTYNVAIAASDTQAYTAIEKTKPDVILLDYEMPYTDGEGVLKKLRSNPDTSDIPVIFFTGSADREVVTKLVSLSPAGYLLKPPNREKMINKIEKTLASDEEENAETKE